MESLPCWVLFPALATGQNHEQRQVEHRLGGCLHGIDMKLCIDVVELPMQEL